MLQAASVRSLGEAVSLSQVLDLANAEHQHPIVLVPTPFESSLVSTQSVSAVFAVFQHPSTCTPHMHTVGVLSLAAPS